MLHGLRASPVRDRRQTIANKRIVVGTRSILHKLHYDDFLHCSVREGAVLYASTIADTTRLLFIFLIMQRTME